MTTGIGVDGCRGGWFYFSLGAKASSYGFVETAADILELRTPDTCILIDIPIGLPESKAESRVCDQAARELLRPKRSSSVFSTPCRQALSADSYAAAVAINRAVLGIGLSKQSWAIADKIGEIDALLREHSLARSLLREAHPEVCFWGLSGEPMKHNKKSREGYLERMKVLKIFEQRAETLVATAFLTHGGFDAGRDDIVDAFVLALCARADHKRTLPAAPGTDATGLPMEMVYVSGRELLTARRTN